MMTTEFITSVRIIDNRERATTNVILDLRGKTHVIFRTPKMMLRDLHQSGRALTIPAIAFDNGYAIANPMFKAKFMSECYKLRGAELIGDINVVKAGDTWTSRDGATTGVREKDGLEINGFLTIPLTETEMYRMEKAEASATMEQMTSASMDLLAMYGLSNSGADDEESKEEYNEEFTNPNEEPQDENQDGESSEQTSEQDSIDEAFGSMPATTVVTPKAKATK